MYLLYGEVVDIIGEQVEYIDQDNEHYTKKDLEFLD